MTGVPARKPTKQAGFVTAEFAACLPAVVLLLLAGAGLMSVQATRIRCADAARDAALAVARGDPDPEAALAGAPPRARLTYRDDGTDIHATVTVEFTPAGDWLPPVPVSGQAVAAREPGVS